MLKGQLVRALGLLLTLATVSALAAAAAAPFWWGG